ncbi:DUF6493 family protein [Hymenobacter sp. H14-R3]|uniref:DUF6493 family protein n=1 Tax=Hymenobacter sp. H14-R3 TaxID=3046308 RepID=UPI0024BAE5C0|nr:DUF6493 family protein [Hymenobacter sp. H14-R3]MDJ0365793.1 DUF6493 family protein [Hymenobacter sp. H14-R3]
MTPASVVETFDQLVRHQPMPALIDFLLHLDKKDLVAVRLQNKALYKEINDWRNDSPEAKKLRHRETQLFLAGLATYSKQEAMGRSFDLPWNIDLDNGKDNRGYKEHFMTIMRHSRPTWFTDLLVRQSRAGQNQRYTLLRELEAEGLVGYDPWLFAQSLANRPNHYNHTNKERGKGLAAFLLSQLQADATLLARDLPLLFDYDTPADSAAVYLGEKLGSITWLTLLPQLVASGHVERADLLTRSLLALRRDFRRPLLTWFKNLFSSLEPTPAERLARQSELTELLAHPLPLVVNFALDQLKDLWADPAFAPALLLRYADGLLTRQDLKTGLKTLLAGFGKLLKVSPGLAPTLAPLYAAALAQADATVQERAAKGLAELLTPKKNLLTATETAEATAAIATYADLLAPAARAVLGPWLKTTDANITTSKNDNYEIIMDFMPDLSAATAIVPVADWHELLFLTGPVLQDAEPADFERWLDGLLRLREQFPAGYAQQLRPYIQQVFSWELEDQTEAEQALTLRNLGFGGSHVGYRNFIRALLASWFADFEYPRLAKINLADQQYHHPDPLLPLERQRLAGAEARLHPAAPAPLPLLSTPSHAPNWIAPTVLVTRLLAHEAAGQAPDSADLVVALARTAFAAETDAAAARLLLPQLAHAELRALLDWFLSPTALAEALPSFAPENKSIVKAFSERLSKLIPLRYSELSVSFTEVLPWLWAVAARTRYPTAELPALRALADYPGVAAPWQPAWHVEAKSRTYTYPWDKEQPAITETWTELTVATEHPGQRPPSPLALYSLHARLPQKEQYYLQSLGSGLPFLLALVPGNPAPLHWHLLRTACRTDSTGSEGRTVVEQVLATLLGAGPRFPESTTVLLAVGLTHAAPTCRALAREVLLAAVAQRRLVPEVLGATLGKLLAASFVPVQRLADGLAQLRAIDPATDDVLTQTLAALLPELPAEPPRNTRKLLDAYADLLGRTHQPVPAPVQARLREWQATASLKKAAALLLA